MDDIELLPIPEDGRYYDDPPWPGPTKQGIRRWLWAHLTPQGRADEREAAEFLADWRAARLAERGWPAEWGKPWEPVESPVARGRNWWRRPRYVKVPEPQYHSLSTTDKWHEEFGRARAQRFVPPPPAPLPEAKGRNWWQRRA